MLVRFTVEPPNMTIAFYEASGDGTAIGNPKIVPIEIRGGVPDELGPDVREFVFADSDAALTYAEGILRKLGKDGAAAGLREIASLMGLDTPGRTV
jgi:hypothetical protein